MKKNTLIFDLGGVVLNNDWHDGNEKRYQLYSDYFGITYKQMEDGWSAAWPQFQLGKISEDEFWLIFLTEAGSNKIDTQTAKQFWRKFVVENESMLTLLSRLKQNYRLAALTTISREWLDYKIQKYNFDSIFTEIVSSGYSGLAKPDVAIYELLLDKLKVNARECVFIDDSPGTLPPASRLGMTAIPFINQNRLEKEFKGLGIKF